MCIAITKIIVLLYTKSYTEKLQTPITSGEECVKRKVRVRLGESGG